MLLLRDWNTSKRRRISARKSRSAQQLLTLLHTSEMHGNILKNTDVGFGEVILSDQICHFCILVCLTPEQQSHCSPEAWFPTSGRARGARRRALTGGQKYNRALNLTESIKQRLI